MEWANWMCCLAQVFGWNPNDGFLRGRLNEIGEIEHPASNEATQNEKEYQGFN